jgi:hypothetical protein
LVLFVLFVRLVAKFGIAVLAACAALGIEAEILLRVATAAEPLLPYPQKIGAESPTLATRGERTKY